MAKNGFRDESFVQELLVNIVKKWDIASGNLNLELILSEEEKVEFQQFVVAKYKELLDGGLEVKVGDTGVHLSFSRKRGGIRLFFRKNCLKHSSNSI